MVYQKVINTGGNGAGRFYQYRTHCPKYVPYFQFFASLHCMLNNAQGLLRKLNLHNKLNLGTHSN